MVKTDALTLQVLAVSRRISISGGGVGGGGLLFKSYCSFERC